MESVDNVHTFHTPQSQKNSVNIHCIITLRNAEDTVFTGVCLFKLGGGVPTLDGEEYLPWMIEGTCL